MKGKRLAFIDIETTGTNAFKHEIIELACVLVDEERPGQYKIIDEFETKIRPKHIETAEPEALRINGYDEAAWMFAPTLEEALTHLSKKAQGSVMVAQNVSFDYSFLATAFGQTGIEDPFFYAKLDTIPLAYYVLRNVPEISSYTLRSLCDYFGIKNDRAHSALADTRATVEVWKRLMNYEGSLTI